MTIKNIDGLTVDQLNHELRNGASFVVYQLCFSIIILTFKRSSSVYFIRSGTSRIRPGLRYTLLTFLLGWWGIPWGPIYTIGSIYSNFSGGKDVTNEALESLSLGGRPAR